MHLLRKDRNLCFARLSSEFVGSAHTTVMHVVSTTDKLILSCILLKVEDGRLKISATNLEIGVNIYIGGKITESGAVAVPARIFSEFISSITDEKINLELKGSVLNIKSESNESNFNILNA